MQIKKSALTAFSADFWTTITKYLQLTYSTNDYVEAMREVIMHNITTNKIIENMKKGIAPTVKLKIMISYQISKNVLYSEKIPCRILKLLKNISQ